MYILLYYYVLEEGCEEMYLKETSQIPLYSQLKQVIKEDIRENKYKVGEQLPTEIDLCKKYNVSRVTVRRAIQELVKENILNRRQGKGTFVNVGKIKRELISLGSFSDIAIQSGQEPSSNIIEYRIREMGEELAELFNDDLNSTVLELKRVLSINETPLIIENSYFPISKFPNLEFYLNENVSLYKILEKYYNTQIVKAKKTLDTILSNKEHAEIFDCDPNSVMYFLKKHAFTTNGEIVHVSESCILSSRVTFSFSVNSTSYESF